MTIRNKLSLQFTGIFVLLLGAFSTFVLYFSAFYTEKDFYKLLENRAIITANIYLEADEISSDRLERYKTRFMRTLNDEFVQIYNLDREEEFIKSSTDYDLPEAIFQKVLKEEKVQFKEEDRQFLAIFYEDNQGDFVILASAIDTEGKARLENLIIIILISFVSAIGIIFIAGRIFAQKSLAPIKRVISEVDGIDMNTLFTRVDTSGSKDEITELAGTFNKLLDRLESAFEMQKTFISNASHELRTPISMISAQLELALMKDREQAESKEIFESLQEDIERLRELTENLLSLAKASFDASKIPFENIRIDEMLMDAVLDMQKVYSDRKIQLQIQENNPNNYIISGNPQLLEIAIKNIIDNALKYSKEEEKVFVTVERMENSQIIITVEDHGVGISQEHLKSIFVTFYRSPEIRNIPGYGLGLPITKKILDLHHAKIEVKSESGAGTQFELIFNVEGE